MRTWQRVMSDAMGMVGVGLGVVAVVFMVLGFDHPHPEPWGARGSELVPALLLPSIAWLLTRRRPDNPVSWALAVSGLGFATSAVLLNHFVWLQYRDGAGLWLAWIGEVAWVPGVVALLWALYRFPTGHRPAGRLGVVGDVLAVAGLVVVGPSLLVGDTLESLGLPNPLVLPGAALESFTMIVGWLALATLIAFVTRFRRSTGIERQQLRWVAYAGGLYGGTLLTSTFSGLPEPVEEAIPYINSVASGLLVVSIAVAVLRFRLYDLDRIVSRTAAYVLLTALVVGLFATVALVPTALLDAEESSDLVVAGATLVAAASFDPLRHRVQALVDRRLHRRRYDARRIIERFGASLRDEVDIDAIGERVQHTVTGTLQPSSVALWLPTPNRAREPRDRRVHQ